MKKRKYNQEKRKDLSYRDGGKEKTKQAKINQEQRRINEPKNNESRIKQSFM